MKKAGSWNGRGCLRHKPADRFSKKGKLGITGFTTIFSLIEFPKALEFEELAVIYPDIEDYVESVNISSDLLQKGTPLPGVDILIAAICIRRSLVLALKTTTLQR